jgi:anaerobic selenocysteine-containing dehydrogenase
MQGVDEAPAHDWGAAELVVSLGAEPRSEALRRGSRRGRARYVHLGPASTVAARAADEFHLVRSGSFGALALGLAKVIVDAGLHDEAFLTERCSGWEAPGLATTLEELDLSEVVAATGLELEALERLGHELGASPAAFALCGTEAYQTAGGLEAAMAVQALNAVLGAIDRPGGVLTQRDAPTAAWPEVEPDEYAEVSLEVPPIWDGLFDAGDERVVAPIDLLPAALAAAPEGRIDTLFLHEINPLWSRPDAEAWRTALAAVPVVVSFSPFWDETSLACADWILPDHSFLERWERAGVRPDDGRALYALRQPTVEPLHGTMQTAELLIEWAKYLDEGPLEAFDWKDAKDLVKDEIIGVYKAKVGSIIESKGSTFLSAFYSAARWHDADYPYESWDDVLRTDSGKLELQPEGHADWAMGLASVTATGAASGDPERYPLLLVPFRPETYTEGSGANQPLLQELRLRRSDRPWTTQVDLHPLHAAEFGVTDGDPVLVTTPVGELRAIARLDEGVFPGELRVPRGGGHTACGRYAAGWGANVATVLSTETKDRFQRTAWIGTRCAIRRDEA